MKKIRVMIVDDSTVIRKLLTDTLAGDPEIEVVGTAANGKIALAKLAQLKPDIITLDVEMPEMDGLETVVELRKLDAKIPIIMFSTLTSRGAYVTFEALSKGASDYVAKPANVGSVAESIQSVRESLIPKIKGLSDGYSQPEVSVNKQANSSSTTKSAAIPRPVEPVIPRVVPRIDVVAIGSSTGGPNALQNVLSAIPGNFPVPLVITQHMPPIFTKHLANRLDNLCELHIVEAENGMTVSPGTAYIAPGDFHLTLMRRENRTVIKLSNAPQEHSCRPAVDVMFRSVTGLYGGNVLGVVLTGMGNDGKLSCEMIRNEGGSIIAQDQASSVVWGMPRAVTEAGLADAVLPLDRIADEICRQVIRSRPRTPVANSRMILSSQETSAGTEV